jgi:hypothetical protein
MNHILLPATGVILFLATGIESRVPLLYNVKENIKMSTSLEDLIKAKHCFYTVV